MVVRLGLNLATYPVYIYNQGSVIEKACMTEIQIKLFHTCAVVCIMWLTPK